MVTVKRRFVMVDGRRAHYLRAGDGPLVLLIHSSPLNATFLLPQIQRLAQHFTCIAFDTPGFGLSAPVPGEELAVSDLAMALARNMEALGLPPCSVFGSHTGAAIALSLGVTRPDRVTALVLDGVPIFDPVEQVDLFDGYFEPLVPDPLGGHFARIWTRFRDQYVWFPWVRKRPEHLNGYGVGSVEAVQFWANAFCYAGRTYRPAYRAAARYGEQAVRDAAGLTLPAVFTATSSDMLYPHLERLPPLRPDQEIRRIGNSAAMKDALIEEYFTRYATGIAPPDGAGMLADGSDIGLALLDGAHGQVMVRHAGERSNPPLLLLHDAPGSGQGAEAMIAELASEHFVICPDMPGCGGSDPLPGEAPAMTEIADAVLAVLAPLGLGKLWLYGVGVGSSLALELAHRWPDQVAGLVLRGVALPDAPLRADMLERYAPPIPLQADGSHWYRTWLMLRDSLVFFPWYDSGNGAALRRVPADFDADRLHDWTFEVMKQPLAYRQPIQAALRQDAAALLAGLEVPVRLCFDPAVPFSAFDDALRALLPAAGTVPAVGAAHAQAVAAFTRSR